MELQNCHELDRYSMGRQLHNLHDRQLPPHHSSALRLIEHTPFLLAEHHKNQGHQGDWREHHSLQLLCNQLTQVYQHSQGFEQKRMWPLLLQMSSSLLMIFWTMVLLHGWFIFLFNELLLILLQLKCLSAMTSACIFNYTLRNDAHTFLIFSSFFIKLFTRFQFDFQTDNYFLSSIQSLTAGTSKGFPLHERLLNNPGLSWSLFQVFPHTSAAAFNDFQSQLTCFDQFPMIFYQRTRASFISSSYHKSKAYHK